jgi:23S rRNA (adenine2503-C2)-methyltransferase
VESLQANGIAARALNSSNNETENIGFKRTKKWKILQFYDILKSNNINVTIRKEFGGNVDAACGQLRAKAKEE